MGELLAAMGVLVERKIRDTALGVLELTAPAGAAGPAHVHREGEGFMLLEGALRCRIGEDVFDLGPGDAAYAPASVPHATRVLGSQPARYLVVLVPSGPERLWDEIGVPVTERVLPPSPDEDEVLRWLEACERHGIEIVGPPLEHEA